MSRINRYIRGPFFHCKTSLVWPELRLLLLLFCSSSGDISNTLSSATIIELYRYNMNKWESLGERIWRFLEKKGAFSR